jgi:hypothetical protein
MTAIRCSHPIHAYSQEAAHEHRIPAGLPAFQGGTPVILPAAQALLAPVTKIDGCLLACLVDASTGMVLAARQEDDTISLPSVAAGAADIAGVLTLLNGELALGDGLEDVMVTFSSYFLMLRTVEPEPGAQVLLLVILDRLRTNLALARREIRDLCAGLAQ